MNGFDDSKPFDEINKDIVTGVFNKEYADNLLKEKFPNMWLCTLLLIDIDKFKVVNDYYRKDYENKILKDIAKIILEVLGELGTVARYSEDRFIAILPLMSKRAGLMLAERIRKTIHMDPIFFKGERQYITVSIGACTFLKDESVISTLEQWIKATENALLQAKAKGKNIVVQV